MEQKDVQIGFKLSKVLGQRIDQALIIENQKNPLNPQNRSDWIRGAILFRLGWIEKQSIKRAKEGRQCAYCGMSLVNKVAAQRWTNLEGIREFSCTDCAAERNKEINNPK